MDIMLNKIVATLIIFLALSLNSAVFADEKININKATKSELLSINGIGSTTADEIIAYREKNGAFSSIDDLTKVKGIGEKKAAKLSENITLTE
jgi:competence protein ComEA